MGKDHTARRYFEIEAILAKEIERKFLLSADTWRKLATHKIEIRDGLLAFRDGRKIRVRFCDDKATLSVKGPKKGLTRDEFEYEIPASDGLALLEDHCDGAILKKTRYFIPLAALSGQSTSFRAFMQASCWPRLNCQARMLNSRNRHGWGAKCRGRAGIGSHRCSRNTGRRPSNRIRMKAGGKRRGLSDTG